MSAGRAVVLRGDARRLPLPDGTVDLICTSPPYFGLRSYTDGGEHCPGQIGSEVTPGEWLAALLECTREWIRVLKPDGSLFVNLGDKYSGNETGGRLEPSGSTLNNPAPMPRQQQRRSPYRSGMPPKSLLGLPWRYALACTDDLGLILRRDIIWAKPNGLPESVTDRCRTAHEYVFHLVKQPRYYSAVDEIREPQATIGERHGGNRSGYARATGDIARHFNKRALHQLGKLPGSVWDIPSQPLTVPGWLGADHFAAYPVELPRRIILGWSPPGICTACGEGRRPVADKHVSSTQRTTESRSSLTRGSAAVRGVDRKALEVIPRGHEVAITGYACACTPYTDHPGKPGIRPTEQTRSAALGNGVRDNPGGGYGNADRTGPWREYHLDGWTPPPTRAAVVVDPFGGTGTTALAAAAYGRIGITVDLSADYCRIARWRTRDPAELASAMHVPKPPPVPDGQGELFDPFEAL